MAKSELPEGESRAASILYREIALFNLGGSIYATDNICTHAQAFLSDGYIDGDCVECPLHQAIFHIPTGKVEGGPAEEPIRTYPVRIDQEDILIELPDDQ